MMLVELTAPLSEALPVAGLRTHLRLGTGFEIAEDEAETAALAGYLRAAIATIEARTGKVLLTRRFRLRLDRWREDDAQPLPLAPVAAVEAVEIEDASGTATALAARSWRLVSDLHRPLLRGRAGFLPGISEGGAAVITFSAGFGPAWSAVPADLAQAIMLLAARYHEDRSFEGTEAAIPFGVSALIERWRAVRILGGRGACRGRA